MSKHREFNTNLGHAGADAEILNAFKRRAHEYININRGPAPGTVYQAGPDGKRFCTGIHDPANDKTSETSSLTNVPDKCASTNENVTMHSSSKDMTKDMTSKHLKMMIRDCVKTVLFRRLKFYNKLIHGLYDFRKSTVMGRVIRFCNVEQEKVTLEWWFPINKMIGNTLTDHRNNVIKTIHHRFKEGVAGKIPHFKQNNGSDADMTYMLAMRDNIVQYVNLIDTYAPCIVGYAKWNDVDNMNKHCGDNVLCFQERVFSVSDEAFLLTVLYNYSANWMSEIVIENAKVQANINGMPLLTQNMTVVPPKYTLSRKQRCTLDGVPGIGWSDEGIEKYNEFHDLVQEDRALNGAMFNRALLSVYTERRRLASNKVPRGIALGKQRAIPRDDLGDLDGDEELFSEDCVYEQEISAV